jgi:hypothetical protein
MISSSSTRNDRVSAQLHTSIALMMLGVMGGTSLLLVGVAESQTFEKWFHRVCWEEYRSKKRLPVYCFTDHFNDYEERFVHKDIPSADYSRGSVCFLGASNMKWALKTWDLPPETRPFIHNFAFGGSKHSDQYDLIRFLVQEDGLLKAGAEKTLVVFGLCYRNTYQGRLAGQGPSDYFTQIWSRHGFYTVEPDGTIHHDSRHNAFMKRIIVERFKMAGLLRELVNVAQVRFEGIRAPTPEIWNQEWIQVMRPNWKEVMDSELGALERAIKYLKQRNVKVVVVRFPLPSHDAKLPFNPVYVRKLRSICESADVKVFDFSKLLDDDDFMDGAHIKPTGMEKFQHAVMGICLDHLRAEGVLPADSASNSP